MPRSECKNHGVVGVAGTVRELSDFELKHYLDPKNISGKSHLCNSYNIYSDNGKALGGRVYAYGRSTPIHIEWFVPESELNKTED